jgi:hypothetical protein
MLWPRALALPCGRLLVLPSIREAAWVPALLQEEQAAMEGLKERAGRERRKALAVQAREATQEAVV